MASLGRRPRVRRGWWIPLTAALVVLSVAAGAGAAGPAPGVAPAAAPAVAAQAAELLDAHSGQVLFALQPHLRMQPASLAKIMTFDLALQAMAEGRARPETPVPVGTDAWRLGQYPGGSTMFLLPNVPVPLADLLTGMMVPSGNDAALAIADFLAGGEAAFVQRMNAEAQALGLRDTHFANASGLEAEGQYTTAADVAELARHIWLTYPDFGRYTNLASFTWNKITQQNFNRLIGRDPRVFGLKSGHLTVAGYHLVATAQQGDTALIAVVLGTRSLQASADESEKLLDWGFSHFHDVRVDWKAALPASAPVWKGRATHVPLTVAANPWLTLPGPTGSATSGATGSGVQIVVELRRPIVAPVAAGERLGTAQVRYAGQAVEAVPVLAARAVPRGGWLHVLWDSLRLYLAALLGHR
jgi:D-alanyl-D-alanine carboxypeptidase (penicillin-binding protein 5/6)